VLIAWTGHRPDIFRNPVTARRAVRRLTASVLAVHSDPVFICGGQRGVDIWSAEEALENGIPLHIILPCPPELFAAAWKKREQSQLNRVIRNATSCDVVDGDGAQGPLAYDLRNERMVSQADRLIAVWTELRLGGTFQTICAAEAEGVPTHLVALPRAAGPRFGRGL